MSPRGGNDTTPRNPAAVSNPQSGNRTDGGPGSSKQPIRTSTGGAYGEAKALREQQQAAPMAAGAPASPGMGAGGGGGGLGVQPDQGVFGPSRTGATTGSVTPTNPQQIIANNPQAFLRVLATNFPHPAIQRLLDMSVGSPRPTPEQGGSPGTRAQQMATPQGPPPGPPSIAKNPLGG